MFIIIAAVAAIKISYRSPKIIIKSGFNFVKAFENPFNPLLIELITSCGESPLRFRLTLEEIFTLSFSISFRVNPCFFER